MNLKNRAERIKIFLMDVDGVLTDGKMYFFQVEKGRPAEIKAFNAQDGIGLMLLNKFSIKTGMITGREAPGAEDRARMLSMSYAYQGFLSKLAPLNEIVKAEKIKYEEIAYMGDDLTDIPVLKRVGLACCPANAIEEVRKNSHFISVLNGGDGAVREVCDFILKAKGLMPKVMRGVESAQWPDVKKGVLKVVLYSKRKGGK